MANNFTVKIFYHVTLPSKIHDPPSHLQDGKVFEDAVHHVSLREVFESVNEADHVVTHR